MAVISKPSRVDRACDRLSRAVAKLEEATKARQATLPMPGGADPVELEALRQQNEELKASNDEAKSGLDDAIKRLERFVGENG